MSERLKKLFHSRRRLNKTGKTESETNQADDQEDNPTNTRPSTHSQPAFESTQSIETSKPQDLWQAAYDQLSSEQRQG
ncbi:uncharacterized protein N7483_000329 [Penicillium malachiteum]|uniref:uncharacterized protein n=1 Tax=Penicillium malachiteum TaxID=1324776 RepID=UPI002546E1B2|nr:uncharacterized protein N7483_000329 [Penicillium malachiteum]KAJ5735204.1 hypothetical protein N7483_000329 [Penicillium malachiteum]